MIISALLGLLRGAYHRSIFLIKLFYLLGCASSHLHFSCFSCNIPRNENHLSKWIFRILSLFRVRILLRIFLWSFWACPSHEIYRLKIGLNILISLRHRLLRVNWLLIKLNSTKLEFLFSCCHFNIFLRNSILVLPSVHSHSKNYHENFP